MKKIFIFSLFAILSFSLVGCKDSDDESSIIIPVRLDTPILTLDDDLARWDSIDNATGYEMSLNGNISTISKDITSKVLLNGDRLRIRAIGDDINYIESDWSNLVIYDISSNPVNMNIVNSLEAYIENMIDSTPSYTPSWNQESFKGKWNYIDGVFLNSIVNLYKFTGITDYMDFVVKYVNYYINPSGQFINPSTNSTVTGFKAGELDSICESRILYDLYDYTNDERYLSAIERSYDELLAVPLTLNGYSFSHKTNYLNQIWLDGMYMYVPFYARYANYKNDSTIFDTIKNQYKYIKDHMYNSEKGLFYHGHDTSKSIFWSDPTTGNSRSFWLRAEGWFMVSLVDSIEYFPDGENKEYLKNLLVECIEGIMNYQDDDTKMFYQLIDIGNQSFNVPASYLENLKNVNQKVNGQYVDKVISNYVESSGSSMVAYTLMKASRLGYISSDYHEKGIEVFEGIYNHSFSDNKLNDICITAGLGPESNEYRDGRIQYYLAEPVGSNDAKGVGPFIMAYLEYIQ